MMSRLVWAVAVCATASACGAQEPTPYLKAIEPAEESCPTEQRWYSLETGAFVSCGVPVTVAGGGGRGGHVVLD